MNILRTEEYNLQKTPFEHSLGRADIRSVKQHVSSIKMNKGQAEYEKYVQALRDFYESHYDASELVQKYLPEIYAAKEADSVCYSYFTDLCDLFGISTRKVVTQSIPKKQPLWRKLLMQPQEFQQITKGIDIIPKKEDFKNIQKELTHWPYWGSPRSINPYICIYMPHRLMLDRYRNDFMRIDGCHSDGYFNVYIMKDEKDNPLYSAEGLKVLAENINLKLEKFIEKTLVSIVKDIHEQMSNVIKKEQKAIEEQHVQHDLNFLNTD